MLNNRLFNVVLCLGIILLGAGCATTQTRITDDTLNKIAVCTGGIGETLGIEAKVQAEIDKVKENGQGQLTVNYNALIKGAISSDASLSDEKKMEMYDKYLACINKYFAPTQKALDISRVHVLNETYITKENRGSAVGFSEIRLRGNQQFSYKTTDQIKIALLFELENFNTDGNNTKLEGLVQVLSNKRVVAQAPIPGIYTTSDWQKMPVVIATSAAKVKDFMGYGEDYLGKKIPYLMIIDDFQKNEVVDGENEIVISINDGLSNQRIQKRLFVQFKKL